MIGSVTLTRIGDTKGRREGFLIGLIMQAVVTLLILFTKSSYFACFLVFLIGVGGTGKQYVGWNLLLEYQPKNKQVFIGCLAFVLEGMIYVFIILYFWVISNHYQYVMIPMVAFGVIGTVFLLWTPESPRFLVSVKRFDEARKSLDRIAILNGVKCNVATSFIF